jgi:opacity protein-like surface antigen
MRALGLIRGAVTLAAVIVGLALGGARALAQKPASVRVVGMHTEVMTRPNAKSEVVMVAVPGTLLEVMDKEGDWYWVMMAPDKDGTRHPGWVQARDVEIASAGEMGAAVRDLAEKVQKLERRVDQLQNAEPSVDPAGDSPTAEPKKRPREDERLTKVQRELEEAQREYEAATQTAASSSGSAGSQGVVREAHFSRRPEPYESRPRIEVFGGYEYGANFSLGQQFSGVDLSTNLARGWVASVARDLNGLLTVVGEVTGGYGSTNVDLGGASLSLANVNMHAFLGGPRFSLRTGTGERTGMGTVTPFAQVLGGLAIIRASAPIVVPVGSVGLNSSVSASENDLALQPGGGVDIAVTRSLAVRVGGDLGMVRSQGLWFNEFRFKAGLVVTPFSR